MSYSITFTEVQNNVTVTSPTQQNITVTPGPTYPIALSYNASVISAPGPQGPPGADGTSIDTANVSITGGTLSNVSISATTITASGNISAANLSGTNTGDQTITLSGDVTGSGTGPITTSIASATVNGGYF